MHQLVTAPPLACPLDQGTASHQNLFCADTQGSVPQPSAKRVVPGAPLESWFYLRVACDDIDDQSFRMPRFGSPLPSAELRVIYDWILQGALSAETIFYQSISIAAAFVPDQRHVLRLIFQGISYTTF